MHELIKHPPPARLLPAVSVIIPLYNAEKYIGECLDSLLVQTFQDFEVIVVDDCSTDNSIEVVERLTKNFGERLFFTRMLKNSGNAGYTARNKGFTFSRGEYVFFMDADDLLTNTALEELYTAAKTFDADVVYTGARYLYTSSDRVAKLKRDRIGRDFVKKGIKEPPFLSVGEPAKRLDEFLLAHPTTSLYWTPWTKFVRKTFLLENEITFFEIPSGGDFIWTIELFARAQRFLRIPNAVYLWRDDSSASVTRRQREIPKQVGFWSSAFAFIANAIETLSHKLPILKENPAYCHAAINLHFHFCFKRSDKARLQISPQKFFEILCHEFAEKNLPDDVTAPFLFSVIDSQQKKLTQVQQQFKQLNQFAAAAYQHIVELENEIRKLKSKE